MRQKIMLVVLALCLCALLFIPKTQEAITNYTPPLLGNLVVATGTISFSEVYKGRGGELLLNDGKSVLKLTCVHINSDSGLPCYSIGQDKTGGFSKDILGKKAKVWWAPLSGLGNVNGRVYQLEVDGKTYLSYDQMATYYSEQFKRNN